MGIHIHKMDSKKNQEPFCGDTLNSLAKIDREFHWSRAYSWYSNLLVEDVFGKRLKASGIVKVGCMLEFF